MNIEDVMADIRRDIKDSGADKIPLSFDDSKYTKTGHGSASLDDAVEYIAYNHEVQPYQIFTGNPIKVFMKKVLRKMAAFFVVPVVQQQNDLNSNFMVVAEAVKQQKEEIELMKRQLDDLNTRITKISGNK